MRYLLTSLFTVVCLSYGCDSGNFKVCGDSLTHKGYNYSTVLIGEQCWFSENCRYLPVVSPSSESSNTTPYYYVHGYEGTDIEEAKATDNYETYGVLYNWPAVMTEGICPSGWHISSDEEWTQLTDCLGGESVAGYAMKSMSGWNNDIEMGVFGNGSNSSRFYALPGGHWGMYSYPTGSAGYWWSASESGSNSWYRILSSISVSVWRDNDNKFNRSSGLSARCVRN